jgi:hypothetical protein
MLKLERKAGDKEIAVSLRHRQQTINATFLKALACAIAIHLIGFFAFNIKIFVPPHPSYLPSTAVEILSDPSSVVQIRQEKTHRHYPFSLPASTPTLPTIAQVIHSLPLHNQATLLSYMPVKIQLSGGLEELELLAPTPVTASSASNLQEYALRYIAQIDGNSGKVFWHQQEEGSGNASVDALGIDIIGKLAFKEETEPSVRRGIIELMITQPAE